jgi:hypothetical protein
MARRKKYDAGELSRGRAHEMEHVDDERFAEVIAEDHLDEDPHYYAHLEACMPKGHCSDGSCQHTQSTPGFFAQTNPGFVRTAADERLWTRAKAAAGRTYPKGSASYWRVANFVFHRMKESGAGRSLRSNPPRRHCPNCDEVLADCVCHDKQPCHLCGGALVCIEQRGRLSWFLCYDCGAEFSRKER